MPDPTIDKLKDRILELENALKEIDAKYKYISEKDIGKVETEPNFTLWGIITEIDQIATKALWPA